MVVYQQKYIENLVTKFYANLTVEVDKSNSPACGVVFIRGIVIELSLADIPKFLNCPDHPELEGTTLEGENYLDEVPGVLTCDEEATWLETNKLNAAYPLFAYSALFRVCCGIQIPTSNMIVVLKDRSHMLYAFVSKKNINLCTIIFKIILRQLDQRKANKNALPSPCLIFEYILTCRDLFLFFGS